jgi:hypothetical protein
MVWTCIAVAGRRGAGRGVGRRRGDEGTCRGGGGGRRPRERGGEGRGPPRERAETGRAGGIHARWRRASWARSAGVFHARTRGGGAQAEGETVWGEGREIRGTFHRRRDLPSAWHSHPRGTGRTVHHSIVNVYTMLLSSRDAASHPFKTHKEAGRESWFSAHQPAQKLASALTSLFSETASSLSAYYSAHSGCPLGQHSRARERKKAPRRLLSVTLRPSSNTILFTEEKRTAAHLELQCQTGDAAKVNWGRDELGLELPWHKRMAGPSRLQITKPHTR